MSGALRGALRGAGDRAGEGDQDPGGAGAGAPRGRGGAAASGSGSAAPPTSTSACGCALRDLPHEEFHVLLLSTQNEVLRDLQVTRGTLDASLVHPREVFRPAIVEAAASVILVHNHPSGDPTPSAEDRAVTRQLRAGRASWSASRCWTTWSSARGATSPSRRRGCCRVVSSQPRPRSIPREP